MVWPPGNVAAVQFSVPPSPGGGAVQVPVLLLRLPATNWNEAGRVVSKLTFGAFALPVLFFTCQVNRTLAPTAGPPLLEEPTTWISALTLPLPLLIFTVELAVLFARFGSWFSTLFDRSRSVA